MTAALPAEVIDQACRAFGIGPASQTRPGGGTAGSNVELHTPAGHFFLRSRSAEHADLDEIRYDHALLAELAKEHLPVQPPRTTTAGETFCVLADRIVELFDWVDGKPFVPGCREHLADTGRQLARLHAATAHRTARKDKPWEQQPDFLAAELDRLTASLDTAGHENLLAAVRQELQRLGRTLAGPVIKSLPAAVVHGDFHPGNALFAGGKLAGLFDWDWANYQHRATDLCDAVFFFARQPDDFSGDDIWAMTCGPRIDPAAAAILLDAYQAVTPIAPVERELLNDFLAARWLQERIRGMRKVPIERRLEFLNRGDLLNVLDHLKGRGDQVI